MAVSKTQFLILRKIKTNEADLVLQVISKEHGRISCLARGALKSKKRFGGGILEPTHVLEGIFQKIQHDRLSPLNEAKLVYDFPALKLSYDKLQIAFEMLAIYSRTIQENDITSQEFYDLLGNSLRSLEVLVEIPPSNTDRASVLEKFFAHFAVKFLSLQGVLEFERWQNMYLKESILRHSRLPDVDLASAQVELLRHHLAHLGKL